MTLEQSHDSCFDCKRPCFGGLAFKIEVIAGLQVRRFDRNQKTPIRKSGTRSVARFHPSWWRYWHRDAWLLLNRFLKSFQCTVDGSEIRLLHLRLVVYPIFNRFFTSQVVISGLLNHPQYFKWFIFSWGFIWVAWVLPRIQTDLHIWQTSIHLIYIFIWHLSTNNHFWMYPHWIPWHLEPQTTSLFHGCLVISNHFPNYKIWFIIQLIANL